jgi:hypothetical protein
MSLNMTSSPISLVTALRSMDAFNVSYGYDLFECFLYFVSKVDNII